MLGLKNGELSRPSFDHSSWRRSRAREARWSPFSMILAYGSGRASGALSLNGGGYLDIFEGWQESWPTCKGITKGK